MDRRSFIKILGVSSVTIALPTGLKYLVDHVVTNNYKPDLLHSLFGDLISRLSPEELRYLDSLNWEYTIYQINGKGLYRVSNNLQRRLNYKDWGKGKSIKVLSKTTNIFEATLKQYVANSEIGLRNTRNFDSPYFWNVIRSYRAKQDTAISKLSKALTGKKRSRKAVAKTHATRKKLGNTGGGENQKIAARIAQLKRTTESRKEAWKKVDPVKRYENYKDKEAHREKAYNNAKKKMVSVVAFKDGKEIGVFESTMEASRQLNINPGSISGCVRNPTWSAKGYKFKKV